MLEYKNKLDHSNSSGQRQILGVFREVLVTKTKPIGKIVYYALRIEFQMRGSPHLHALIWCDNCPKLSHDNKQAYIKYIDKHVQAYLPKYGRRS